MSRIAVYMVTHGNPDQTERVIALLRKTSGCEFDLFVADSGSGPVMQRKLQALETDGKITWLELFPENIGQNLGANACLDEMEKRGAYDCVVCWSPDVEPKTRRLLKKMARYMKMFDIAGAEVLIAPKVSGAKVPTALTASGDDIGFPYYVCEVLKGYVRAMPGRLFNGWRLNVYGALAHGEAAEVKDRATALGMSCVTVENLKVKHVGGEVDFYAGLVSYGL